MIVDDDQEASAAIAEALRLEGYEPLVVHESTRAIEMAEISIPQAFLVDLVMPPDGFQLCRSLRQHPQFRRTPILIVTALDPTDSKIVAIGAGASDYITKPFHSHDLISKLSALLTR